MSLIHYVNGKYLPAERAVISIEDRGFHFSDGVYEVIAFANRRLVDAPGHLQRLVRSCKELRIRPPMTAKAMSGIIAEVIRRNKPNEGAIYIQITRGAAPRNHIFPPASVKPTVIVSVCCPKLPTPEEKAGGVRVITQPDLRWARRDIKTISLLPNVLAKQAAVEAGVKEAWLVMKDGVVTEGTHSNAYIVSSTGIIVTHPATHAILGGITRERVLGLARRKGLRIIERPFTLKEALAAKEAFMTSTTGGVLPVTRIGDKTIGGGKPGKVTQQLMTLYDGYVARVTAKK